MRGLILSVRILASVLVVPVIGLWIGSWVPGVLVFGLALAVLAASVVPLGARWWARVREPSSSLLAAGAPPTGAGYRAQASIEDLEALLQAVPPKRLDPWLVVDIVLPAVAVLLVAFVATGQEARPSGQCVTAPCSAADGPPWSFHAK